MSVFLPEDDRDYLHEKQFDFTEMTEALPDGKERRGLLLQEFAFTGSLCSLTDGVLAPCQCCDLLVLIPEGYATTKLDSFYTGTWLKRPDGANPDRATGEVTYFDRRWQFWSRHLDANEWRVGVDGIGTFLNYVWRELQAA